MAEGVYTAYTPFLFERSVIMPKKMLKNIFVIVGTMVLSLALFMVMFGDTGKKFMWNGIEPVMTGRWVDMTYSDGVKMDTVKSKPFEEAEDLSAQ